ncbi:MAG: patatin-like phospholipase family protein [Mycoplasmatota bacterium]|nr:patatin-like phospholipase family protein [Mycoplasmatota bacterium]
MKALVLSGGGAKGAYQIGVWKALKKLGVKFDIVTGTSVGALNGTLIVQNEYRKAVKIWKKINLKSLFNEETTNETTNLDIYKIYGKKVLKEGGMDTSELEEIINQALNKRKFFSSKINYGLITYNLTDKKPVVITKATINKDSFSNYLVASASCFPAFKEKIINQKKYIDGGYYDNLPINLAIDLGATEIIAVDLNAPGIKQQPKEKIKTTTIKPRNKLTSFLYFQEKATIKSIKYGYNDTMKAFHKLEGNKYTFKKNNLEKNLRLYLDTYLHILNKILKYKKAIHAFEEIIKIDISTDKELKKELLEKLFTRIMENLAKSFDLDDSAIYTTKSFNNNLKRKLNNYLKDPKESKKEVELYLRIVNNEFNSLRKEALLNPIDLLKAIYLYTICEA